MDFPWMDEKSYIKCSIRASHAAFPAARAVNVSEWNMDGDRGDYPVGRQRAIVDSDFVNIRGDARSRMHTVITSEYRRVTERGLRAPARDPNAQHVLLRSGDHHGHGLCSPAWYPHSFFTLGCTPAAKAAATADLVLSVL